MLTPGQFQPGAKSTYDLALRTRISRKIARNMATQYAMDVLDYRASPRQTVNLLKRSLTAGSVPYTLFILWDGGGHALTPYAVFDRGTGSTTSACTTTTTRTLTGLSVWTPPRTPMSTSS